MAFAPAAAITPMRTKRLSSAARSRPKSMALDGSSANRGQSPRSARAMVAMPAHYPTRSLFAYARPVAPTRGPRPWPRIWARPALSIVACVHGEGRRSLGSHRRQRLLRAHRGSLAADSLLPQAGRQTRGRGHLDAHRARLRQRWCQKRMGLGPS
jgi:hypothetical protein